MFPADFRQQLAEVAAPIAGRPLDARLDAWLNAEHGPGSASPIAQRASGESGVAEGWLCDREGGGIRYGRIFEPAPDRYGFSVEMVDMKDMAGPHHTHRQGEIGAMIPTLEIRATHGRHAGDSRPPGDIE